MEWAKLSEEAKSVIEWIENPFTRKRELVSIEIGKPFNPIKEVIIPITKDLFEEILQWVKQDSELTYEHKESILTFKLRDDSRILLH